MVRSEGGEREGDGKGKGERLKEGGDEGMSGEEERWKPKIGKNKGRT